MHTPESMIRDINRAAGGCPPVLLMGATFLLKYERLKGAVGTDEEILSRHKPSLRPDGIYEIRVKP